MELYDVMSTTFASRNFTDEPLPDETLFKRRRDYVNRKPTH